MFRYSRRIQLERMFGAKYRFESAEFSSEAETKEGAIKEVEQWIEEFKADKLKQIKSQELSEEPFVGSEFSK